LIWNIRERLSINKKIRDFLTKRTEGGTQIFIFGLFIVLFLVVLYRVMFDYQRMGITKDAVDDALVTSMISGCIYNRDEFASSGNVAIYRKVTPNLGENIQISLAGIAYIDDTPVDVIGGTDIGMIYENGSVDSFLTNSYTQFEKNLKKNLKLDGNMIALISGIRGEVRVDEFSIYNKYYNLDEDRNQTDFRFVKYTYNRYTCAWSVAEFAPNTYPSVYNSLTKTNTQLTETSIVSKLSFDFATLSFTSKLQSMGYSENDTKVNVSYQRIVDVKKGIIY